MAVRLDGGPMFVQLPFIDLPWDIQEVIDTVTTAVTAAVPAGPAGPQGTPGTNGSTGATGSQGPAGPTGPAGSDATTKAYEGTIQRTSTFPIVKSAVVSSGTAVFNLTADGLSTGTALFPNGVIQDSVSLIVNDATASYQMSWAFSNSNKTITVTANKLTTANILTGILGQGQANGSTIKLIVYGY